MERARGMHCRSAMSWKVWARTCSWISNLDLSFVSLSALSAKLDPSLDLFADVILNPSFPEAEVKREQKLVLAGIEREQNTPR